ENFVVTPIDNWYFNIISVFVLTIIGGLITTKYIEPRLGKYTGEAVVEENAEELSNAKKGFIYAMIAGLIYIAILVSTILLPNSPLTNEDGGIVPSPFISGIVPIILLFFV